MDDLWCDIRDHACDLGAQLKERRQGAGVSLNDLALRMGADAPLLSRIENGQAIPTRAQAVHLKLMFPETPLQQPVPLPKEDGGMWARTSDPVSSHLTVASIDNDTDLHMLVRIYAKFAGRWWNDWNLTQYIEGYTGRTHQRNVIARARGRVERDGYIERAPWLYPDHRGRKVLHFRKTQP